MIYRGYLIPSQESAFKVIQPDAGTAPVATSPNDTLTMTSADGSVIVTGDSSTDTIDLSATAGSVGSPALVNPSTDNAIVRFDGVAGAQQNSSIRISDGGVLKSVGGVMTSDVVPSASSTMWDLSTTSGVTSALKFGHRYFKSVDSLGNGFEVKTGTGIFGSATNVVLATTFTGPFDSLDFEVQGILGQVQFYSAASPGTSMGFNPGANSMFSNGTNIRFATGGGGTGMMTMDQLNKSIVPSSSGTYPAAVTFDLGGDSTSADSQIRAQQWKNVRIMGGLGQGLIFEHYLAGSVIDGKILSTTDQELFYEAYVADSATAVGHIIDTNVSLTTAGAKIASFRNATVEKASVDKDGSIEQAGTIKAIQTATALNTTLTNADYAVLCDASLNAVTIDLPAAASHSGREYSIKCIDDTNTVTIDANAAETIDGSLTQTLILHEAIRIISDGSNWWII